MSPSQSELLNELNDVREQLDQAYDDLERHEDHFGAVPALHAYEAELLLALGDY